MSYQFVSMVLNKDRQLIITGTAPETIDHIALALLHNEGHRQVQLSAFFSWNMDPLRGFKQVMQVVQQHLIGLGYTPASNGYVAILVGMPKMRESADMLAKHFSHCFHPHIGYAFTPLEVEHLLGPKIVP